MRIRITIFLLLLKSYLVFRHRRRFFLIRLNNPASPLSTELALIPKYYLKWHPLALFYLASPNDALLSSNLPGLILALQWQQILRLIEGQSNLAKHVL